MQKLQNKVMRITLKCDTNTHINQILDNLKRVNLKQKLAMNTSKLGAIITK